MKHLLLTIVLAFATSSAFADGFNPWDDRSVRDDRIQEPANVVVSSFYRDGSSNQDTRWQNERQVAVSITPYYLQNS